MEERTKTVAIIGAGLSGLLSLYHLSRSKEKFHLTAFDRNYDIGGLWLYTDQNTTNEFGLPVQTGMYKYLRTNLPLPLMTIPGHNYFDSSVESFPSRETIFNYLQNFCDKNGLRKYIKFNTLVKNIVQINHADRNTKWNVTYGDIRMKNSDITKEFDYVIVCNGNCSSPRIPDIKGSEQFKGTIKHSMYYRHPEIYSGHRVAILGGMFSALEIGIQLTEYAKMIYMCHKGPEFPSRLPENMIQKLSAFGHITETSVVLENGEEIEVDSIIYCTGYQYSFPFLPDNLVKIKENRIRNLFKEIFLAEYSTIMFMSIPRLYLFFPMANEQARYIYSVLSGSSRLPDPEKMKHLIDNDFCRRVIDFETHWEYAREISELGKFKPLPKVLQKIEYRNLNNYFVDIQNFRKFMFRVTGPDSFTSKL